MVCIMQVKCLNIDYQVICFFDDKDIILVLQGFLDIKRTIVTGPVNN